jgi:hypothetical protein
MSQLTCKNCKNNISSWAVRNFSNSVWWRCGLENNREPSKFNPVDGTTKGGGYNSCGMARAVESICGAEARHWTPRRKKDLFMFLKRI